MVVEPLGKLILRGLYKLQGDELILYFSGKPSDRPKGFNEGEFRDKWIYQRKKENEQGENVLGPGSE